MAQQTAVYDPTQQFEYKVFDVEYRNADGQPWMMRIYQPQGAGPFPMMLDVHGGAWNGGGRDTGELKGRALASTGMVVASIELRKAPDYQYPAQVEDANFGVRWLKSKAGEFNGDAASVGIFGISSGGNTAMQCAMLPNDPQFTTHELPGGSDLDASVRYAVLECPVLDPFARYQYAKESGNERLAESSVNYFLNEEGMKEGNPQMLLERGVKVEMPPVMLVQGTADGNVPMSIPDNFVKTYEAAGGSIQYEVFPGMPHSFGREPGPETDREVEMIKAFIAKQLSA